MDRVQRHRVARQGPIGRVAEAPDIVGRVSVRVRPNAGGVVYRAEVRVAAHCGLGTATRHGTRAVDLPCAQRVDCSAGTCATGGERGGGEPGDPAVSSAEAGGHGGGGRGGDAGRPKGAHAVAALVAFNGRAVSRRRRRLERRRAGHHLERPFTATRHGRVASACVRATRVGQPVGWGVRVESSAAETLVAILSPAERVAERVAVGPTIGGRHRVRRVCRIGEESGDLVQPASEGTRGVGRGRGVRVDEGRRSGGLVYIDVGRVTAAL